MIVKVVIPQYVRKVKMSDKQIPIYYEYKNGYIKAKNKPLPDKFLTEKGKENRILNEGRIEIDDLLNRYEIRQFKNNKLQPYALYKEYVEDHNFNYKYYLCTLGNRIVSNPIKVGTPKMKVINAQDIFSGKIQSFEKESIMLKIKKTFVPYIQNLPAFKPEDYPLRIRLYVYDTVKNEFDRSLMDDAGTRWDMINRSYMYSKAFGDLLVEGLVDKSIKTTKVLMDDDRLHVTEDGGGVFCPIENPNNRKLVFVIGKDDENFAKEIEPIEQDRLWLLKNNRFYKHLYK